MVKISLIITYLKFHSNLPRANLLTLWFLSLHIHRYNENLLEARQFGIRKGAVGGSGQGVFFLVMFSAYGLAFWYGSKLVREGSYTGGDVTTVRPEITGNSPVCSTA